jgi:hypothetical protein
MANDEGKELSPFAPVELPKLTRRLIDASLTISDLSSDRPEFLHAVLCQLGLPRSRQNARTFERHSGGASLLLEAGSTATGLGKWAECRLPYGAQPRLVLYHLCSEAVRTQSNVIDLGGSVREFLRRVGISYGGPQFARFKQQMTALAVCRMTIAYAAPNGHITQMQASPIDSFDAWLHSDPRQTALWPDVIELHPKFFNTLIEHAVPLDPRAIGALQHSALALDVYTWLAHRLCRVRKAEGVKLSWSNLRDQFGQEYACSKDFKKKFRGALLKVCTVYPAARLGEEMGGIRLYSSPAPVPKSQVLVKLPA